MWRGELHSSDKIKRPNGASEWSRSRTAVFSLAQLHVYSMLEVHFCQSMRIHTYCIKMHYNAHIRQVSELTSQKNLLLLFSLTEKKVSMWNLIASWIALNWSPFFSSTAVVFFFTRKCLSDELNMKWKNEPAPISSEFATFHWVTIKSCVNVTEPLRERARLTQFWLFSDRKRDVLNCHSSTNLNSISSFSYKNSEFVFSRSQPNLAIKRDSFSVEKF